MLLLLSFIIFISVFIVLYFFVFKKSDNFYPISNSVRYSRFDPDIISRSGGMAGYPDLDSCFYNYPYQPYIPQSLIPNSRSYNYPYTNPYYPPYYSPYTNPYSPYSNIIGPETNYRINNLLDYYGDDEYEDD